MSGDLPSDAAAANPSGPQQALLEPVAKTSLSRRLMWSLLRIGAMLVLILTFMQRSLIYQPTKTKKLLAKEAGFDQPIFDVSVKTHDGLTLNGWLAFSSQLSSCPPEDPKQGLKSDRPLVIVFPGNAGCRINRSHLIQTFGACDSDVLIFDYRSYGENPGKPSETNLVRDARSIWDYATKELEVPAHRIVIYGESLGGGVATQLARRLCDDGIEPGGLIVESTFNSLVAAGGFHYPLLPVSLILFDRFESQRHITKVNCPILQIHGERDRIVPFSLGEKLFAAAPDKSSNGTAKKQVRLPNADHNDVYGIDRELVFQALKEFFEQVKTASKSQSK